MGYLYRQEVLGIFYIFLFIICFLISIKLTNWGFRTICRILDIDVWILSIRSKMSIYLVVAVLLMSAIVSIFFRGIII